MTSPKMSPQDDQACAPLPAAASAVGELVDRSSLPETPSLGADASLMEICRAMGAGLQLTEVLDTILGLTLAQMRAQQGSILLFDEHQDRLQMLASVGLPDEIVNKGYIQRKGSIAEWVIDHAEPLILNDRPRGSEFQGLDDTHRRIVSAICVPLKAGGGVIGTINLNRTEAKVGPFGQEDLDGMAVLASQAAIYIENSRLHESLLQNERLAAIGQTVAGVSHCMKNLLTGMKGGISLSKLAVGSKDWEVLTQGLEILDNSVQRISKLALDMLNYSKEREPDRESVDLDVMMKEIRGVTRDRTERDDAELTFDIAEDARILQADGHEIFRCLLNLVENALDANKDGSGRVTVTAERSTAESALSRLDDASAEAAIVIRVSDNGPGISEDIAQTIFEPFFSTKGSKGTGLGLAVTRKIVGEHGGRIELASEPGEPAVFAIYLPA